MKRKGDTNFTNYHESGRQKYGGKNMNFLFMFLPPFFCPKFFQSQYMDTDTNCTNEC
jgi:hypothetical protein